MLVLLPLAVLVSSNVPLIQGFAAGAPDYQCPTMMPLHGTNQAQTTPLQYTLSAAQSVYKPGDIVSLTLSGGDFAGYLIQARTSNGNAVGRMIPGTGSKVLPCGTGGSEGLTHRSSTRKTSVTFSWEATNTATGEITFYATIVEHYNTFWVAQNMLSLSPDTGEETTSIPLPQTSFVSPQLTTQLTTQTTTLVPQALSTKAPTPATTTVKDVKDFNFASGGPTRKLNVKGGNIRYDDACGSSKGCFVKCEGQNCDFLVTWRDVGASVQFELYGKPGFRDAWVAVGFSKDTKMGDDSVTECISNNGIVQVFNSENIGYSNRKLNPPQIGLSNFYGAYNDGILYCTFRRQKFVPGVPAMFDLDQDWNIMFASGEARSFPEWIMIKHVELPPVSASRVDYQSFAVIGSGVKYTLVKAHGCLMILAWVLFTGVGIVAARYYKNVWSDKTFLKLKIWFQVHRACMVSAVVLNAVAFIIIFIEVEGYSEIDVPGKAYLTSHPILGIIVTALCLTNPVMALFRPSPDDSKRPIFNWAHWGVGMLAYILSAICICFGFQLAQSSTPDYAVYIMIVYIFHIIVFDVIFELLDCMFKKQKKAIYYVDGQGVTPNGKVESVEMSNQNGQTDTPTPNGHYHTKEGRKSEDRIKTVLLAVHVALTGGFALVLVLVVALN